MRSEALLVCLLGFAVGLLAQNQMAQCPTGWEWSQNSLGQDPCKIASILEAYCSGNASYTYGKLNSSQWYSPPSPNTGDLTCVCDTVKYSLIMACTICQNAITYGWDVWSANCSEVFMLGLSVYIPQGTAVPRWAYYNVTVLPNGQFNIYITKSIGRDPEALPNVPSTTPSTTPPSAAKGAPGKTGEIVGGVVGGIGFLIVVIAAYFCYRWWLKERERRLRAQRDGGAVYDPPTNYGPDAPTEPILVPIRLFHLYAPVPAQVERQGNRKAT